MRRTKSQLQCGDAVLFLHAPSTPFGPDYSAVLAAARRKSAWFRHNSAVAHAMQPESVGLKPLEVTTMINNRWKGLGSTAAALLAAPAAALAQAPTTPLPTTPTATAEGGAGLVGVVAALIGLIVVVGIIVKFYDAKRKREEEGVVLQARLSDALLLHPSLARMPVVASVHMPWLRGSPPVVELKGTVSNQAAREIAIQVVQRELDGFDARLEDEIFVDPQGVKRVAA
jgi:hypothetical protein